MRYLISTLLLTSACAKAPEPGECKALLRHLADLELKQARKSNVTADKIVAQLAPSSLDHCLHNLSSARVECSLRGKSLQEVEACDNQ